MSLRHRPGVVLTAMCAAIIVVATDTLMLGVALPTLSRAFEATTTHLQWFLNAYTLVVAALTIPGGLLADRLGRRRVLVAGLVVFGVASIGASLAGSPEALIAWRVLTGAAAAVIAPATLAILRDVYPQPAARARAIGLWSAVTAASIAVGPVLGGWLLQVFSWQAVFLINVPLVLLTLPLVGVAVGESRSAVPVPLDPLGLAFVTLGAAGVTWAMVEAPVRGWGAPLTLSTLLIGTALMLGFAVHELRTARPLLGAALRSSRQFTVSVGAGALVNFALFAAIFLFTQYLELVLGYSTLAVGNRLVPIVLAVALGAAGSARLSARFGRRWAAAGGLALAAIGLLGFGLVADVGTSFNSLLVPLIVLGVGLGLGQAVTTEALLGAAPPDESGKAVAVNESALQFGGAFGVAALGSAFSSRYRAALADVTVIDELPAALRALVVDAPAAGLAVAGELPEPVAQPLIRAVHDAFVSGLSLAIVIGTAVVATGALLVAIWLPHRDPPDGSATLNEGAHDTS